MFLKKIYITIFIISFSASCSSSQKRKPTEKTNYLKHLSHFLSGNPISQDSPYYQLSILPFYKKHSVDMNDLWKTIEQEHLNPISKWEKNNLIEPSDNILKTFYPFSGADFVNLYGFFPASEKYTMVALEKPGQISDPLNMNTNQVRNAFLSLKILISEISERNYFRRRIMKQQFQNPHFSGVLPALIFFMTKMGLEIEDISKITVNDKGEISASEEKTYQSGQIEGIKINFFDPKSFTSKELIYLNIKLNENSHSASTPEGKYFQKMKKFSVLMKSAEYLFPRINLNGLRDFILNKSRIILQDDSGIPFSYFSEKDWNIKLFGKYNSSALLTGVPLQPVQIPLKEKYSRESIPLNFSFGYGILKDKERSNIMLFIKK